MYKQRLTIAAQISLTLRHEFTCERGEVRALTLLSMLRAQVGDEVWLKGARDEDAKLHSLRFLTSSIRRWRRPRVQPS